MVSTLGYVELCESNAANSILVPCCEDTQAILSCVSSLRDTRRPVSRGGADSWTFSKEVARKMSLPSSSTAGGLTAHIMATRIRCILAHRAKNCLHTMLRRRCVVPLGCQECHVWCHVSILAGKHGSRHGNGHWRYHPVSLQVIVLSCLYVSVVRSC